MNKPTYLSQEGLDKLRSELTEMTNVRRTEVAARIHDAKEHGDLSENAEYEDAKNEQAFVEGRIQTLEALIKNATLFEHHGSDHVQIGSTVVVDGEDGVETFSIVGLHRGQADRRPDLQRVARRAGAPRPPQGRQDRRPRPGRRLHVHGHARSARAAAPGAARRSADAARGGQSRPAGRPRRRGRRWIGRTSWPPRSAGRRSSTTARRRPAPSTSAPCAARSSSTSSPGPCAPAASRPTLLYGVDDLDPMDAQALLTPDAVEREMGRPLAHVPDQAGDGHASYARHHAQTFIDTFAGLGIHPDRYYWMSEIYAAGDVDPYIRIALDRAARVREIYRRVANVQHPDEWHPLQVVCETCGKVGTTIVTKWDGERVYYECRADARDVGARVRPRRLDRRRSAAAASSAGTSSGPPSGASSGSRSSRAARTSRPPAAAATGATRSPARSSSASRRSTCPYEFLNIGGRKMSTSKGHGAAAHRIVEVVPPDQLRFLFIRPRPNSAIEFDPDGTDAIPRLFDEFDRVADAAAGREVKGTLPPSPERLFAYAVLPTDPAGGRRAGGRVPARVRPRRVPHPATGGGRCRRPRRPRRARR